MSQYRCIRACCACFTQFDSTRSKICVESKQTVIWIEADRDSTRTMIGQRHLVVLTSTLLCQYGGLRKVWSALAWKACWNCCWNLHRHRATWWQLHVWIDVLEHTIPVVLEVVAEEPGCEETPAVRVCSRSATSSRRTMAAGSQRKLCTIPTLAESQTESPHRCSIPYP